MDQLNSQTLQTAKPQLSIEEQLLQIQELEKRKDAFISTASHELKTPVTTLKVYLHIIEEYFRKADDKKHLQYSIKATEQINKLSKLINDLLDLSKIPKEGLEVQLTTISYFDFLKEVIENFQKLNPSHQIKMEGSCTGKIKGDKERLLQAVTSLLSNAVKYSPNQNKIVVSLSQSDNIITTSVKDFGIGIPKNNQDAILEKFYRFSDKKMQTFPGIGVGLYITNEIIKRHGGNISAKSEEGRETNFTFTLPIFEK